MKILPKGGTVHLLFVVLIVAACGCAAVCGNPAIRALLGRIDRGSGQAAQGELIAAQKELPGGRWIGILERLAIFVSIVAGFPTGIALVLAVKGLGRYPELRAEREGRDPARVGELFIIGTLASVMWASAWAGIAIAGIGIIAHLK